MEIKIENRSVTVRKNETLQDIIRRLGLDSDKLSDRPLAGRLAGTVVSLHYMPDTDLHSEAEQRAYVHAMRAAAGSIKLIRYSDAVGKSIYERTSLFILLLAFQRLFPEAVVHVDYALAAGLLVTVKKEPALSESDTAALLNECRSVIREDLPLKRRRLYIEDAIDWFGKHNQPDKSRLLEWRTVSYFDVYGANGYLDYFYGEMLPSTGYATVFQLKLTADGLLMLRPSDTNPDRPAADIPQPNLRRCFRESADWNDLMHCTVVADLNDRVMDGSIRELVRVNEALHEKEYANIADSIVDRGAQAVMLAGPSSSGKTTSANRLCTQLRVHGKTPILFSLDDYYIDRDKVPPGPDGTVDLEHINTIDTELFCDNLTSLLSGETVELPRFDFVTQRRVASTGRFVSLDKNTILVVEGLHGLNPALLPSGIDPAKIFRLYVSALTTLNLDDHNRIHTTSIRLLRRMVRDYRTRNSSVERTLSMWASVRAGEERWIFPYQENADAIFNSALVYEPAVLKKYIYPLLMNLRPSSPWYDESRAIVKFLNYVQEANIEDEIPPTSILREFIGGNAFYRGEPSL